MSLRRRKWTGAKIETNAGVPETITAAECKILSFDATIEPDVEFEDRRPDGIAMGQIGSTPGMRLGRARVRVEFKGSGTSGTLPLWASTLLTACGMKVGIDASAGIMSLVSSLSDQKTVTYVLWEDGRRKRLYGAMGNATISGEAGKAVYIEFELRGIYDEVIDASAPTGITHETTQPIRLASAAMTFDEFNPRISQFSLNFGNDVQIRAHIYPDGASRDSGASHAYIADRSPRLTCDPESPLVAAYDLHGMAEDQDDTDDLAMVLGTVAGNILTILAPKIAFRTPTTGNRNGLNTDQVEITFPTATGDSEFTIDFNDPE